MCLKEYTVEVEQFEFIKVTEIMDQLGHLLRLQRLERIRSSILTYLEGAQSKVEHRIDSKLRLVLKEAYDLLEGVKVEIESIQGNIVKLLKPVKSVRARRAPAKKAKPAPKSKTLKKLVARSATKAKRSSSARA
jgi:hypothetical protein